MSFLIPYSQLNGHKFVNNSKKSYIPQHCNLTIFEQLLFRHFPCVFEQCLGEVAIPSGIFVKIVLVVFLGGVEIL